MRCLTREKFESGGGVLSEVLISEGDKKAEEGGVAAFRGLAKVLPARYVRSGGDIIVKSMVVGMES